ncbi:MAG: cyclic pyranopterin monophosphate synthase MoaC [Spirochaetales bacterium]|nr:cyclic pyranopterin monophosphate synthase MoaC [Spirochaetales bacterium]
MELSHTDENGNARMVDISDKGIVQREARATGIIHLQPGTIQLIKDNCMKKGDVISVARIAGIEGAKKTSGLIPLCHNIPLNHVSLDFTILEKGIMITAEAKSEAKTGVEMEALTAVATAALTIYDMCKGVDKSMRITDIVLARKVKHEIHH